MSKQMTLLETAMLSDNLAKKKKSVKRNGKIRKRFRGECKYVGEREGE